MAQFDRNGSQESLGAKTSKDLLTYLNSKFTESEARNLQFGPINGEELPETCTFGLLGNKSRSYYEMAPAEKKDFRFISEPD